MVKQIGMEKVEVGGKGRKGESEKMGRGGNEKVGKWESEKVRK